MANLAELHNVYERFCSFGSNRNLNSTFNLNDCSMEGSKFAKLCRETNLLDKNITPTEVDITFNRVKGKTERKINFGQFQEALNQLAAKKYPGKPTAEAFNLICATITGSGGPIATTFVKPAQTSITERLTDPNRYTGTQKAQFGSMQNMDANTKRKHVNIVTASSEELGKVSLNSDKNASKSKKVPTLPSVAPNSASGSKANLSSSKSNLSGSVSVFNSRRALSMIG
jgi:hypothetical protein